MGVDKFGRFTKTKDKGLAGPKGEGFKLTQDGNYDMQGKRLCNVEDPYGNLDAINFKTHAESLLNCMTKQSGHFDAQQTRVCNMANPVESYDAVTKQYMELHTPVKLTGDLAYSVHQYRLQDVAVPKTDGDAVNLAFFNENTITRGAENGFDAKGWVVHNVAQPLTGKDAVNLDYVNSNTVVKNKNGAFDVKNTVIQNLAPPSKAADAVNKQYMDERLPLRGNLAWNFKNKRLAQIADPSHIHDAVTLKYIQENVIRVDTDKNWDANSKRLTNVAEPYALKDAVNKQYMKEFVAELAYTVYKQMNQNKRASVPSFEDWKIQVVQETSTWDDLFKTN